MQQDLKPLAQQQLWRPNVAPRDGGYVEIRVDGRRTATCVAAVRNAIREGTHRIIAGGMQ